MKTLIIGFLLGAVVAGVYFMTFGKIRITEKETIRITLTETNWVDQPVIRYVNETRWITRTNTVVNMRDVWRTNIVEQIVVRTQVVVRAVEQAAAAWPIASPATAPRYPWM